MYLLSTPSSAGSLLRPPPPDGLAATEPGLLRLPPPPSPTAADRPATPRPAREQDGEEPAEVARLLLRLLLLLPPPPLSALWVALSMIAARPGRGWPPRWQPHRRRSCLSCSRRCCSSGLPGGAWLLRFPGKCLTHTGGRGGGGNEGWEGSQPGWMQLRPPLLPPRPGPGPALPPLPGLLQGSRSLLLKLLVPPDRWGPGLGMPLGLAGQTGWARPRSAPCTLAFFLFAPTRIPRVTRNLRRSFPPTPTHLGTWREGQPHPPGPPGYGPARSLTPARSLSVCRRTGAWAKHVHSHLKISLTGGA